MGFGGGEPLALLVMPMGLLRILCGRWREDGGAERRRPRAPERPPKRMPTRSFFLWFLVMEATSFYYFGLDAKKVGRGIEGFLQGVLRILVCFVWVKIV